MRKSYVVYQTTGCLVKCLALVFAVGLMACEAEECDKSEEGHKKCDGATLMACIDGSWDQTDCLEDACPNSNSATCQEDSKTEAHCVCH